MKGTQRIFRYFAGFLVLAMLVVACQPAAPAATSAPVPTAAPAATSAPAPTATPAGNKVTVRWYHIATADNHKAFYQKVADDYMAAHPNVNVEITVLENEAFKTKLTTLMQSGDPPDIFQSWGGGTMVEYVKAGLLKDITADVTGAWADTFGKGALGVYAFDGKQYGVPRDMGMVGIWYNKALFKQAGIDKEPTTWTEFLDAVKKLQAAKITPIAVGAGDKWPAAHYWMWANVRIGGQAAFDKAYSQSGGSFADEPFVKAGEALKQLIDLVSGRSFKESELLEAVKKLKAAGITPIAAGAGDKWPVAHYWMWANVRIGGQAAFDKAYNLQGTFADEPFVKAGEALKQLIDLQPFQDGFLGHTYGDADKVFANKQAAMELMGQWELNTQRDNSPDKQGLGADLGFFPFPVIEGGAGGPNDVMGGGNGWAVGKNAPPEAIDFLKALTSKDEQCGEAKVDLGVPVVNGSQECLTDPYLKQIGATVAKAKYFQLYYDQFLPPATGAASNDAVQGLFAGTSTPAEVAKLVQESYAAELKK